MILQQRNGRRKCTKTKVKNSSFRNKYDRVEAEDPEDVIVQPKIKGGLISECIIIIYIWPNCLVLSKGNLYSFSERCSGLSSKRELCNSCQIFRGILEF